MRTLGIIAAAAVLTAAGPVNETKTYTGIVTDTMCGREHASMKMGADPQCVRACVGDGKTYKYALWIGDKMHTLSDQETPAQYAAQKVTVVGVLYPKTNIIKVVSISPSR